MPRIKRRFARIDPIREACTIRISFFTNAMMKIINSTAFPKLTLSRAPSVGPSLCATLSVAYVKSPSERYNCYCVQSKDDIRIDARKVYGNPHGYEHQQYVDPAVEDDLLEYGPESRGDR
jgi:hypothetical protein